MEYQKVKCKLNKREQNVNVSIMKKVIPKSVKLIWSAEKYNEQTPIKIGQSWPNVQAVPLTGSFSKPPEFLPARGTRPNKRKKNSNVFLKKKTNYSKECKTATWSAQKQNVGQTIIKIGQSPLSMQAVPLAGSTL